MNKNNIVDCVPKNRYKIWIKFADGLEGIVDVSDLNNKEAFRKHWGSETDFQKVYIDPETHTLAWGYESEQADINPRALRVEILQKKGLDASH